MVRQVWQVHQVLQPQIALWMPVLLLAWLETNRRRVGQVTATG